VSGPSRHDAPGPATPGPAGPGPAGPDPAGPASVALDPAALGPELRAALTGAFGAPELALAWIDRFLEPDELRLVAALAAGPLTLPAAAAAFERSAPPEFFERAVRRAVIDRPTHDTVALADFASRFEVWTLFEGWKDLPHDVRRALADWSLARYVEAKRPQVESLLAGEAPQPGLENAEYLLLPEAEALLARAAHVYLWPCDCRAAMERCRKPSLVCLRFNNDRGLGWEISHERAVQVLRDADSHGLMHTGEVAIAGEHTPITAGAICNCCGDCCFPQLAAEALGATRVWPRVRYVAERDPATCTSCGRCARRCPFGAFAIEAGARAKGAARGSASVTFRPALCRGCGLCATGCPEGAITMTPLAAAEGR